MKSSSQYSHGVISGGMLLLRARSWPIRHARALLRVHFFAAVNFIIRMSCLRSNRKFIIKSNHQFREMSVSHFLPSQNVTTDLQ